MSLNSWDTCKREARSYGGLNAQLSTNFLQTTHTVPYDSTTSEHASWHSKLSASVADGRLMKAQRLRKEGTASRRAGWTRARCLRGGLCSTMKNTQEPEAALHQIIPSKDLRTTDPPAAASPTSSPPLSETTSLPSTAVPSRLALRTFARTRRTMADYLLQCQKDSWINVGRQMEHFKVVERRGRTRGYISRLDIADVYSTQLAALSKASWEFSLKLQYLLKPHYGCMGYLPLNEILLSCCSDGKQQQNFEDSSGPCMKNTCAATHVHWERRMSGPIAWMFDTLEWDFAFDGRPEICLRNRGGGDQLQGMSHYIRLLDKQCIATCDDRHLLLAAERDMAAMAGNNRVISLPHNTWAEELYGRMSSQARTPLGVGLGLEIIE
ncbi:uncharacterized protein PAC_19433 [Phialocephala subalpina]|uniref:Uncharacterized protein n=1 Tax=Phialocephala subalpina TaxID=576137 RepID=A0A1L7XWV6_9HELO|nr:uncharacterized protein PAC_19433 [Phialocephala subalpina]